MTDLDIYELKAELELAYQSLERLTDQLVSAVESDNWLWETSMVSAIKPTSARIKSLRRRLKMEVAA